MRLRRALLIVCCMALVGGCGGDATTSSAVADAASRSLPRAVYPLHVEAGKRFLVDAAGKPFLINGDSPWNMMVELTRDEVDEYLEDRVSKGVNTVLVELVEHHFASDAPNNAYGEPPFTIPGDFSRPNKRYFAQADYVIRKAAELNVLVLLVPLYVGYRGGEEGWYREMVANGTQKLYEYGRYVGNRYKDDDNIIWVEGGDYNVPNKALVRAVANGIRSVDGKPQTYHGARGTAAMEYWGTAEPWLTVDTIYTTERSVVAAAREAYSRSSAPFFLIEARYEGDNDATEQTVRMQAYQALLSGGAGHVIGRDGLWQLAPGWQRLLDNGGARSLLPLRNLFGARAWSTLSPDLRHTLLTRGIGTGPDRAVAARAQSGRFALAYLPTSRAVSVDLRRLAGPRVAASWVDPSNGASTPIEGSPFRASGTRSMRPPGDNASGFDDWVLRLVSTR